MLSIFQKKELLVDQLEGFTDFHNHILPGIDDGADTPEESLRLIKKFGEFGIENFVATPHVMGDFYPNTPETINTALNNVRKKLDRNISLKAAAEYMMDQNLLTTLASEELLTIFDNHILVEMSYFQPPINLEEILFKIQNKGYKPVLAHPERYAFYHGDFSKYEDLKSRGCLFQLNMLSLTTHYGKNMQKAAFQLLEDNMIDFLASDAHRLQHLEKLENIGLSKKQMQLVRPVIDNTREKFSFS